MHTVAKSVFSWSDMLMMDDTAL